MKKETYIIIVFLLMIGVYIGGVYVSEKNADNAYNNAVTLTAGGSYEEALSEFEKANPNKISRNLFLLDVSYGTAKSLYKNTIPLYVYASARLEYSKSNADMTYVNDYLKLIPEEYNGELSGEIKTFKADFELQYEEYLDKLAQERAEERKREEERKSEEEKPKTVVPYSDARKSGKKSNTDKSDPYNAKDYYDAEDFYDDNYDDFFDYEDAEDYYNEHGGR